MKNDTASHYAESFVAPVSVRPSVYSPGRSGLPLGALVTLVALSLIGTDSARGTPPLRLLPTNTRTVAIVNNYAAAWRIYRGKETGRETGSAEGRVDGLSAKFGLTPDELAAHVSGPVMRAEMRIDDGRPAELLVALIDDPSELLAAAGRRLARRSAKVREGAFDRAQSRVYSWTDNRGNDRASVCVWHQGHLILADDERAARQVASLMVSQPPSGLTAQEAFAAIWDQVGWSEAEDGVTLFWYVQPWLHEQKGPRPGGKASPANDNYLFAQRHGLTGIRAMGGRARVPAGGDEQVEAVTYAPRPLPKSLKIFEPLRGDPSRRLPDWIAAATGNVVILHGNIPESLRHISLVFDDAFALGVTGTYDQVLEDLKAEDGLGIDLVKDLYAFLGSRAYLVWGDRPGRDFRPFMIAFETTDVEKVSRTIDALMRDDPEAKTIRLENAAGSLWHVAGENGGEDFTMGVVQTLAIYANDLRLVRQMMSANRGQKLKDDQMPELLPLLGNGAHHPFLLVLDRPRGGDSATSEEQAAGLRSTALDLIFQGPDRIWPTDREWNDLESVMRNLMPFGEQHRIVAGFVTPHGWRFTMRKWLPDP